MKGRTVVVTGGAGFIGSHLVDRLLAEGARVRVVDDLSTGQVENLGEASRSSRFEMIEADIQDESAMARAVKGATAVFHEAAQGSVPRSVSDPMRSHRINSTGTLTVLLAAREAGVSRVVYASSSSVYGDTPELPKVETMLPQPLSPYATAKITGEYYVRVFAHLYGMKTLSLRYFNVFGPRQDPSSQYSAVIPKFIDALGRGARPVVYGDGGQSRDFTYISDVVEANLAALEAPDQALGQALNVAAGRRVTLLELLDMLSRLTGRESTPEFEPKRAGDVRHSQADSSRAEELLGWQAVVEMEEGLRRTLEAFPGMSEHAG